MEQRKEKRKFKVNFWHVIFVFGGGWAFYLLGYWSALLLCEAWIAIKSNLMEAYAVVIRTDNVLKAGGVAFCAALIYGICEWMRVSFKEQQIKKSTHKNGKSKQEKVKKHQSCKKDDKEPLTGELFIEVREEEVSSENSEAKVHRRRLRHCDEAAEDASTEPEKLEEVEE